MRWCWKHQGAHPDLQQPTPAGAPPSPQPFTALGFSRTLMVLLSSYLCVQLSRPEASCFKTCKPCEGLSPPWPCCPKASRTLSASSPMASQPLNRSFLEPSRASQSKAIREAQAQGTRRWSSKSLSRALAKGMGGQGRLPWLQKRMASPKI